MIPARNSPSRGFVFTLSVLAALAGCSIREASSSKDIVFWHWLTDREPTLKKLADQFNAETGLTVRLELYAPSDSYSAKVRAAAQTNTLPDLFGVLGETQDFSSFIKAGHVADLTPAMNDHGGAWKNAFVPKALASVSFEAGNHFQVPPGIYGVPLDVANLQLLFNKTLFAKAGLNPEKPPRTWPEFIKALEALRAAGIGGLVSGWGEPWMLECFASNYAFNIMGEQKVLDTYRGKVRYTDPDWITVLSLFDELRRVGGVLPGAVTMVNKAAEQAFANEKAAVALNGSWSVNVYRGMNPNLSYGVMLPPAYSTKYPVRIWGGAGTFLVANAKSPRREAAVRFLKWLSEPAQQTLLAKETLNLPANKASAKDLPKELAAFASRMDKTTHPSQWPIVEKPVVTEALAKGIQSILIGEKTPDQVASEVEALRQRQNAP